MDRSEKIKAFLLAKIPAHESDIVTFAATHFDTSRQNIHRYLTQLLSEGSVVKTGSRKATRYYLATSKKREFQITVTPGLQEDVVWTQQLQSRLSFLPENILRICEYGFTEMLNNVIDHSGSPLARCGYEIKKNKLSLWITDEGIGVFEKLRAALGLTDYREAILHLSKGKVTTDPSRHSGEGIFFTSRAFDEFALSSNRLRFERLADEDWLFEASEQAKGTAVSMQIALDSRRELGAVFSKHTDAESHRFDKTKVVVELSRLGSETYISRSQAKRVLVGLEKFREVVLDFKNVKSVGQGFVDEVFRVFKRAQPEIEIHHVNANPDVLFMINRA